MAEVTKILERIDAGDEAATDELLPIVYEELRRLARRKLASESPGQTLQPTELVHEAYLRLTGSEQSWGGKAHFFSAAAEAMRRILVDRARRRGREKRGGDRHRVQFRESALAAGVSPDEILVVHDLFDLLAQKHPVEAEVVKLRYFAGFNVSETARALGIPVSTAHRHWTFARAWLYRRVRSASEDDRQPEEKARIERRL